VPTALQADCASCVGLCCVALALTPGADFAIAKPAGRPCPNLAADHRCRIHAQLRPRGFAGCAVYDCFGAGQRVSQVTFGGRHDRAEAAMFDAFTTVRALHELLWYLTAALDLDAARPLFGSLRAAWDATDQLAGARPDDLRTVDVAAHRDRVNARLQQASGLARASIADPPDHRGADLVGASLRRADLRGANLRGARLVGADLRGADLALADLTGTDLRGATLHGADLAAALFVTQAQLDAATGDAATALPPGRHRPNHWRTS
jgi:uncharacterized protein YjbI with pentapeptide repeats